MKNIVELAIDAAEAAIVLGARALCAVSGLTESPQQNVHVDNLYEDTRPSAPGYYREHFANWDATKTATEASPEASPGQPLASVVDFQSVDDFESAAFACRKYADMATFGGAQLYWRGVADRIDVARDILAIPLGEKK